MSIIELEKSLSELHKELWGEAILVACFLTNRSPTKALHFNKTPYEMWFNKKPNLSRLQIFGSVAYALVPKERRQKLDKKYIYLSFSDSFCHEKMTKTIFVHHFVNRFFILTTVFL